MKQKEPTRAQLEQRIKNAHLFIPKDKDSKSVYFDDKGLRLTYTMDFAIVETGFHRHVFSAITSNGYSRPYLYLRSFIDIADQYDCIVKDGKGETTRSYAKLMDILKDKEDDRAYNTAWYVDKWLFNIFAPLYSIDESHASTFIVYEQYLHNVARMDAILAEKTEDVTNRQYVHSITSKLEEYVESIGDEVLFKKLTDEELAKENMDAMAESEMDESVRNETAE